MWQVLAACEKGLGFGIPHSHLNHLNSMEEVVSYFNWRVEEVAQHGQSPVWALPQLGSCASPGQAWRGLGSSVLPWRGQPSGAECSSQPPPRPPRSPPLTIQVARQKADHDAHWTHNLPPNVSLQGVSKRKLRALSAWEANDAGESKDAPRQDE